MPTLYDNFERVKAYTYENYVNYPYLGTLEEISEYILGPSPSSSPENVYASKYELSSYVSKVELSNAGYVTTSSLQNCGYATQSYVADYVESYASSGGDVDLSSYVTYDYLENQSYVTSTALENAGYITINDIPIVDTSSYVTYSFLNSQSYLTSIPSEYITSDELTQVLNSYITETELSNCGYLTQHQDLNSYATKSYVADYVATYAPTPDLSSYVTEAELSGMSYATTSDLASYLPLSGGTLTGNLTLANTYFLTIGDQRAWKLFEDGSGSGAYIALQANVDSKNFYIRDNAGNNVVRILESSTAGNSQIEHFTVNTYTNNIIPKTNNSSNLGSSSSKFAYTYTNSLILNGTDIVQPLSVGKIHYGTAVHDRTSYTTTCAVDSFEVDSNGNPLVGTTICVKLTSITGTNPATLYPVKFIVNGKENSRWYGNAAQSSFGNGRNWYRDMNDGTNRYWYWFWDGTYWVWHGISDERDTTYSSMTDAEASDGTSTTARLIKPVTLATYYTAKSCFSFDSSTNTLTITTT